MPTLTVRRGICAACALAGVLVAAGAPAADGSSIRSRLPLCGVVRVYSPSLTLLLVPIKLTANEVKRYELVDQTRSTAIKAGQPWWMCVTRGKITREAEGNLSSGSPGRVVAHEITKDQTTLELGAE